MPVVLVSTEDPGSRSSPRIASSPSPSDLESETNGGAEVTEVTRSAHRRRPRPRRGDASTSSSSTPSVRTGSRTRRPGGGERRSTTAKPRSPTSCGRPASRTCSPMRAARRGAAAEDDVLLSQAHQPAYSSTRFDATLARSVPRRGRGHAGRARRAAHARRTRARARPGRGRRRHDGDRRGRRDRRRTPARATRPDFTLVSEELGERVFGNGKPGASSATRSTAR